MPDVLKFNAVARFVVSILYVHPVRCYKQSAVNVTCRVFQPVKKSFKNLVIL